MKYLLGVYGVGFAIATIMFGPVALIHPLATGVIVGGFIYMCKRSEAKNIKGGI